MGCPSVLRRSVPPCMTKAQCCWGHQSGATADLVPMDHFPLLQTPATAHPHTPAPCRLGMQTHCKEIFSPNGPTSNCPQISFLHLQKLGLLFWVIISSI